MFSLNGTLKKSGSVGRWETKTFSWDGHSGICRRFCLYLIGRIFISTIGQSWSDKPGKTLTSETRDGFLVIIRSSVLYPLVGVSISCSRP